MEEPLSDYRALLKDDTVSNDILRERTLKLLDCITTLVAEAGNEIKKQSNETEDTDS